MLTKKIGNQRLLKLADHLEDLSPEQFDFSKVRLYRPGCGTVACAIGWTPEVFPKLAVGTGGSGNYAVKCIDSFFDQSYEEVGAQLFAMTRDMADNLFSPQRSLFGLEALGPGASPKQVAARIRDFVRLRQTYS